MVRRTTQGLGWMTILMLAVAAPALADSHAGKGKNKGHEKNAASDKSGKGPSAESRVEMAEAHEKLAACLRSTRPIDECHAEMAKAHHGAGQSCACEHCEHGEGKCSEHGSCERGHHGEGHGEGHGESHGKGTSKNGKAPSTPPATTPNATPTTSGPTQ